MCTLVEADGLLHDLHMIIHISKLTLHYHIFSHSPSIDSMSSLILSNLLVQGLPYE